MQNLARQADTQAIEHMLAELEALSDEEAKQLYGDGRRVN